MKGSRIPPLARKEFKHILRDPRSLWIVFMLPIVMMFLFGYAIDLDLKDVRLGVCDLSRTPQSRELVEAIDASSYFSVVVRYENPGETGGFFERRVIRAGVIIPRDFARALERERRAAVGLVIDGSDANSASIVQNYLETFIATRPIGGGGGAAAGGDAGTGPAAGASGASAAPLIAARPVVFYNRALDSTNFIVPGLVAIVMMMLGALLTSVTIAREKETGTMEQILVSPIRPFEVIAGKTLPYLVLAFSIAMIVVTVGHFWFKVPFVGSVVALMLYCLLYLFAALALGILISTLVSTQQVAMMLSLMVTLLPSIMLSGFIFPIASMPRVLQFVSNILPATHFLVIVRGVMLKGNVLGDLWPHVAALVGIGLLLMILAVKRFSLKLGAKGGRA
ncbi:MAG: ABC transporter permease [Candidatus Krumholzibacteriia bacterium]